MFYICFILRLRESFDSRFQEGFTIHFKKTRTLGIRLLTTSAGLYFRRSFGPPLEEKERGLISRTAACKSSRGIAPRLPPFQVRPSKSKLFCSQLTDSERKQKNTQNPNRLWPREKSCFVQKATFLQAKRMNASEGKIPMNWSNMLLSRCFGYICIQPGFVVFYF